MALAVPVWWKTTSHYRADIPFESLGEQLQIAAHQATWEWRISVQVVHVPHLPSPSSSQLFSSLLLSLRQGMHDENRTQVSLLEKEHKQLEKIEYKSSTLEIDEPDFNELAEKILTNLNEADDYFHEQQTFSPYLSHTNGAYTIFVVTTGHKRPDRPVAFIGKYRHGVILASSLEEHQSEIQEKILGIVRLFSPASFPGKPTEEVSGANSIYEQIVQTRIEHNYHLTFSILHGYPTNQIFSFPEPISPYFYLKPFFSELEHLINFTIDSEVVHFVSLLKEPKALDNEFFFTPTQLTHFFNPNDLLIDYTITSEKTLSFMIYIPATTISPLKMYSEDHQPLAPAFLLPGKGGVYIYNPETTTSPPTDPVTRRTIPEHKVQEIASIFLSQLRKTLGIKTKPSPANNRKKPNKEVVQLAQPKRGITEWEVDVLGRKRLYQNLKTCVNNLQTLSSLIQNQKKMVVPDHIATKMESSLFFFASALGALNGSDFAGAIGDSIEAQKFSSSGFSDAHVVNLLYFPDEHELAIYIPHFVPVFYPIVLGVVYEIGRFFVMLVKGNCIASPDI